MSLSEVARLLWRAIWFERRLQPRILTSPKCAAATRPGRTGIGESRAFSFSGRLAESAKTRGASESEPAALKVQLGEGLTLLFDVPLGSLEENLLNLLIL